MSPTYRGNVQAKFNLAECDLDPVNVNVALSARLAVKKANNKWVLSLAGVNLQPSIGPGSDTRCVVGGLLDASGTLQDKLNEISGSMKSKVEALTFPIPIDDLESKLAGPIVLPSNGGRTVCVYPRITGLQIGGLQTSLAAFENAPFRIPEPPIRTSLPNLLEIPLAFLGAPSVLITNNSCPPAEPVPGNLDVSEASTEMPFRLLATIGADYPALSAAATSTLKPTQGQWGLLKLKFKPTRLQVANANGQVLAALSLTGSISGTVYFWGTPATSIDGKTVFLSNLNLAAESRAALSSKDARLPDFIANLFKAPIQEAFSLNLAKVFPQSDGSQPISFPLPNNGILRLGALKLRIDTVKSVEGQLDATIVIEGDPGAWNP
jgi:hypothetical protein